MLENLLKLEGATVLKKEKLRSINGGGRKCKRSAMISCNDPRAAFDFRCGIGVSHVRSCVEHYNFS